MLNRFIIDDENKAHMWIGYTATSLVVLRIIWGFIGVRKARFSSFKPSPNEAILHLREIADGVKKPHFSHNPFGALMVYNFLFSVLIIGTTGFLMTTNAFFGNDFVEDTHQFMVHWVIFTAFLHVGGVIFESIRLKINLLRSMIRG